MTRLILSWQGGKRAGQSAHEVSLHVPEVGSHDLTLISEL